MQLNSRIVAVVVYPDRARLTRRADVTLEPGVHHLDFNDLPISLDPGSLRASATGSARARLLGLQSQRTFYSETPDELAQDLEQQVEALQDELRLLEVRQVLLQKEHNALALLGGQAETFAMALAAQELKVDDGLKMLARIWEKASEVEAAQVPLGAQKRGLERRLGMLKNQLEQVRSSRPRERYAAVVELEVFEAGELAVELSYTTSGARWEPLYDLRMLEPSGGKPSLAVGYQALVTQTAGENWVEVELTLSTARPALAGRLPELQPWFISPLLPPPPPVSAARKVALAPSAAPDAFAMPAPQAAPPPRLYKVEESPAQVEQAGSALSYHVPGKVTIPPDGTAHKVTVANYPLEPRLDYVSAPRLTEAAYRRAKVANTSPYTLLPGRANIFVEDEFIGSMQFELVAPQEEMEVFLGVDDRIRVKRELKRRETDKRLIGNRRRIIFGYEITVENLLSMPANLRVQDQFPVARHEEIKTRLESAEPRPAEADELNILTWELALAANEKRILRFDFSVEHPVAMEVRGL